jgi:protein involved in polysaccharide export with SLBB domain
MDDKRKSRFIFNLLFFVLFMAMLTSCATTPSTRETTPQGVSSGEPGSSKHVKALNQKMTAGALAGKKDSVVDYRIGTDDLLEITVYEDEKLNRTLRVSPQGNITFPLIGVLRVKDLTVLELEKEIRDLLSQKYLKDPHVTVFVKEYRSQRIIVMGAVEKPNVYSVPGQITILDLLILAGGLKEDAGSLLFLIRSASTEKGTARREEGLNSQEPRTYVIEDLCGWRSEKPGWFSTEGKKNDAEPSHHPGRRNKSRCQRLRDQDFSSFREGNRKRYSHGQYL